MKRIIEVKEKPIWVRRWFGEDLEDFLLRCPFAPILFGLFCFLIYGIVQLVKHHVYFK